VVMTSFDPGRPVTQRVCLAYEVGFKTMQFDRQLTLNAAAFTMTIRTSRSWADLRSYLRGRSRPAGDVPKSHVEGFGYRGVPQALEGSPSRLR